MSEPAIELRHVSKTYPGSTAPAVEDLSITVPAGELVVFVGPSGCGKTTTLRMINRLEDHTSGEILIDGVDISTRPAHELRRSIGYVIQQVGLFPHRTVADNIATVPSLLGWDRKRIAARVDELVDLVDLDRSLLGRYPAALSGGQQQRVGVARALAVDPPILLMDEPYSAVDPIVRAHLQDELIALHHRLGTTIVLVTHDIDEAVKVGDRIAVFAVGGRLAQYATPDELLRAPADDFVGGFLGGERSLRRLGLVLVKSLDLDEPDGVVPPHEVALTATARQALDVMVSAGIEAVAVRDGDDLAGVLTLSTLTASVR